MVRVLLIAAAALLSLGAKRPETVDYRLGVITPAEGSAAVAEVEIRFRGDPDGETRLDLPTRYGFGREAWRHISDLSVSGAEVSAPDAAHRVLRHRPGRKLVVRYRVQTAYPEDPPGEEGNTYRGPLLRPGWFALIGDFVFATPAGREHQAATFRWGRLPRGWSAASDLEHGQMGQPLSVSGIVESISVGGVALQMSRSDSVPNLRVVRPNAANTFPANLQEEIATVVAAQRQFWADPSQPYFVALVPLTARASGSSTGGTGRGDGFILYATPGAGGDLGRTIAHEHTHTWIPRRVGRMPPAGREPEAFWFSEGFTDFFALRTQMRAGLISADAGAAALNATLGAYDRNPARNAPMDRIVSSFWQDPDVEELPYQRGALLALKWDEDIRRKTDGKADLDDVLLRMRDHYLSFPPGEGPDMVTGLVSAAWVVAQLDLRSDIARYAERGDEIPLPEQMFDGCLDARVTVSPGFDSGFDHEASAKTHVVQGVRRRGPAWNSGLRDGMRIEAMDLKAGDMSREIVLTVRPARGRNARARTIRYWPYGDNDVERREIALAFGLQGEALAACGRKIAGL